MSLLPLVIDTSRESQGGQNEAKDCDDENDTNDIELPKQGDHKSAETKKLVGRLVSLYVCVLAGSALGPPEGQEQGKCHDREDDTPHSNSPLPSVWIFSIFSDHPRRDITRNPCVDLSDGNIVSTSPFAFHLCKVCMRTHDEGCVWDKGKEESRSQCGQVGNDNLDHQNDQAVPDLIDDGSGRKAGHVVACTFDNGTCFGKVNKKKG